MHRLVPEKLVTIISTDVLEERLVAIARNRGASGYTILRARGAGSSGEQSGMLDADANIKFHVILPTDRLAGVLDDLERLMSKRYPLTVFVSDVAVLGSDKFDKPMG
ncbi:MAG TPA: transcriptional regulator [Thioalkalivibrio sp.]|nr:transcriptional regulator [Thioalkalivibrio sp.]